MILVAEHSDGFSELLLGWKATISHRTGIVEARWFNPGGRKSADFNQSAVFEMRFEQLELAALKRSLKQLKPYYNGHVDDFPHHSLRCTDGDEEVVVSVDAGFDWPPEEQPDIDLFYALWNPIAKQVEGHPDMPQR